LPIRTAHRLPSGAILTPLCHYLPSRETQREVQGGLNVVENWNATTDFLCYGRQGELATNSREQQEV
jgi:TnpA family transposase